MRFKKKKSPTWDIEVEEEELYGQWGIWELKNLDRMAVILGCIYQRLGLTILQVAICGRVNRRISWASFRA